MRLIINKANNNEMLVFVILLIFGCHTILMKYFSTLFIFTYLLMIKYLPT